MGFIIAGSVLLLSLAAALVKLTRHFLSSPALPVTAEWIDNLSIDKYRPMLRLLDSSDLDFLRAQPGFQPYMVARLRVQRCRILQQYLSNLDIDFRQVGGALKLLMVQSQQDRPDLASALLRGQMTFGCRMSVVYCQLFCYRFGIGTVDVTGLLTLFNGMRLELRTFVPAELAAGA